jgi:hypothetical protein
MDLISQACGGRDHFSTSSLKSIPLIRYTLKQIIRDYARSPAKSRVK